MIAITSTGNKLSSLMDMRFAKCSYFYFLKEEDEPVFVMNPFQDQEGHIAPAVVTWLKEFGITRVITGEIGSTAQKWLKDAHIQAVLIDHDKHTMKSILKKIGEL